MFLSKVSLKRGPELFNWLKQKSRSDGYIAHQLLWDLFPNDGGKKRDFLFHIVEKEGLPQFLIVSETEPLATGLMMVNSKNYSPKLLKGEQLAFSLVANPVVSRKVEGKKNSAKHDVWMDAKKQAKEKCLSNLEIIKNCETAVKSWIIVQGEQHCGFHLDEDNLLIDGYMQNRLYKGHKANPIKFSSIHYEGILTITDTEKFIHTLYHGIGRSKAFGCGLMLVRRI